MAFICKYCGEEHRYALEFSSSCHKSPLAKHEITHFVSELETTEATIKIAANPSTPPQTLEQLSINHISGVRAIIAGNPSTWTETLARLAKDTDDQVREAVANNPHISFDILEHLVGDVNTKISKGAIRTTLLRALFLNWSNFSDRHSVKDCLKILHTIALNPNTPATTLEQINKLLISHIFPGEINSSYEIYRILETIASHHNISVVIIESLIELNNTLHQLYQLYGYDDDDDECDYKYKYDNMIMNLCKNQNAKKNI